MISLRPIWQKDRLFSAHQRFEMYLYQEKISKIIESGLWDVTVLQFFDKRNGNAAKLTCRSAAFQV
jgi:hypothetical protein